MGKTKYGYTQQKLEEKAAKRGITVEGYVNYLRLRYNFRLPKGVRRRRREAGEI